MNGTFWTSQNHLTEPHNKLLYQFRYCGINGNICKWIDYFSDQRRQLVVVYGKCFPRTHVDSEVPQGVVLVPFLLYINDPHPFPSIISFITSKTNYRYCLIHKPIKSVQNQIDFTKHIRWIIYMGYQMRYEIQCFKLSNNENRIQFYTIVLEIFYTIIWL